MPSEPCVIVFDPQALQDLRRFPGLTPRFLKLIDTLRYRPERGHLLRGELYPCRSLVLSRRSGGYRAVYDFDAAANRCTIIAIGEHATVYDVAFRRYPPQLPPAAGNH